MPGTEVECSMRPAPPRFSFGWGLAQGLLLIWVLALILAGACAPLTTPEAGGQAAGQVPLTPWKGLWEFPAGPGAPRLVKFPLEPGPVVLFPGSAKRPGILTSRPLKVIPGQVYTLRFFVRREAFVNSRYLGVTFFGHEFWLDSHCVVGGWQEMQLSAKAPSRGPGRVVFHNDTPSPFFLARPSLTLGPPPSYGSAPPASPGWPGFALGAYAYKGSGQDMAEIAACGLNSLVMQAPRRGVEAVLARAQRLGLKVILIVPPQLGRLEALAHRLAGLPPGQRPLYFYLQDEPELRSYPVAQLVAARKLLREKLPWSRTATALVRPDQVARYSPAYDAVFMDQYPVPGQPLSWLADSVARARALARPGSQVWAVVQAFGGGARYSAMGWSRLPTPDEMGALAAGALSQGAQGLLFYRWRDIRRHPEHRRALCRLAGRLRGLRPWLPLKPGLPPGVSLDYLWRVKSDPHGGPAVRAAWKTGPGGRLLLLSNQTPYPVRLSLKGLSVAVGEIHELWQGNSASYLAGEMRLHLEPLGVRVYLLPTP
jgi:hypothetical protein